MTLTDLDTMRLLIVTLFALPMGALLLGVGGSAVLQHVVDPLRDRAERISQDLQAKCRTPDTAMRGICGHATDCDMFRTRACALTRPPSASRPA